MALRIVPNWDEYWMSIAQMTASRSKDPSTQVGCVIVSKDNHQVSMGYNGFPAGMPETDDLWERPVKYALVVHSEMNALLNATSSVRGCKMYVTHNPCSNCAKHIAAAGISEVIFAADYVAPATEILTTEKIFELCSVKLTNKYFI